MKIEAQNARWFIKHMDWVGTLTDEPSLQTFAKLSRLEKRAHRLAEQHCNGEFDCDDNDESPEFDRKSAAIIKAVHKLLPKLEAGAIFHNGDPRGYALKFKRNHPQAPSYTDYGQNGILAPEF